MSFLSISYLGINDEGATEEEMSEKILYFIPSDCPLEQQVKYANIAEAMIEFFSSFEEDSEVKNVESDKYRYFLLFLYLFIVIIFVNGKVILGLLWFCIKEL